MKVTFKTIKQEVFELSVNEDQTILDVKAAIAKARGEDVCPVQRQKLIYAGKILDDSDTFDSLDYDGKKFIVLMVMAEKKPVVEEVKKTEEVCESKKEASTATPAATSSNGNDAPTAVTTASKAVPDSSRSSGPLTAENQEKLSNLISMGYPESEALAALRAAYFNQPRAVEYLITGIPDTVPAAASNSTTSVQSDSSSGSSAPSTPSATTTAEEAPAAGLNVLQNDQEFERIRDIFQANPEMLQEVIHQIADLNPAIMSQIHQNPTNFLARFNFDNATAGGGGSAAAAPQVRGGRNVRELVVEVTEEEKEAIDRLKAMGFPEQLVIEAFIACDRNEELAVDYIIARLDEFHL